MKLNVNLSYQYFGVIPTALLVGTLPHLSQKIPSRFMRHMVGRTSGSVSLVGPSGNTWPVNLIQQNDDLFFHHGWPAFVRDHYIECGDFLVFRYDGELNFTVQIFDQSACEKEAAFHSECSQDLTISDRSLGHKREREEDVTSSDKIVEDVLKKMRESSCQLYLECIDKNRQAQVDICNGEECQFEGVNMSNPCEDAKFSKERNQCGCSLKNSTITSQIEACNENPGKKLTVLLGFADKNLCSPAEKVSKGCSSFSLSNLLVK